MRQLFLLLCIPLIHSCSDKKGDSGYNFKYDKTSLGTLKEEYRTTFEIPYNYTAKVVFVKKHKEEVLKTLEVVEEIEVEKDVFLIFYRYSIGTDIVKKTEYMRKMDGLYYPYSVYYSSYNDDPFKNGKGEEAKKVLTKAEEWEKNENIWWAF